MGRQESIARSIVAALTAAPDTTQSRPLLRRLLSAFAFLFALYQLPLFKIGAALFAKLRRESWKIDEKEYVESFVAEGGRASEDVLNPIGDMGFSGSTFFDTTDKRYLVKSVPRHFEHSFFRDDLLEPYGEHMAAHPKSLLIRISDFLAAPYWTVGSLLGLAPTHHIVMENILYGKESTEAANIGRTWESWDLKPQSYFFPERDIAQGKLASEATKSRLADEFNDKLVLSQQQADEFFALLDEDTKLLAQHNAVDYSLFLIRISPPAEGDPFADPILEEDAPSSSPEQHQHNSDSKAPATNVVPVDPVSVPPSPPTWRAGIPSHDDENRYVYRAAILDFFWAKHKAQPIIMTVLIRLWNLLISRHGHMSITTNPEEYRERFISMCREIVEVRKPNGEPGSSTGSSR